MDRKLSCPECGHNQLHCDATIKAVLKTKQYDDGSWDYELFEWEDIESIESYDCLNCGFGFLGDEKELLEISETDSPTVTDEAS